MKNIFCKRNFNYFYLCQAGLFFILSILLFCGKFAFSAGTNIQISVTVINCNNNGICDTDEDELSCPSDCVCNFNDICEADIGERSDNCSDCPVIPPVIPPVFSPAGGSGILFSGDVTPPAISGVEIKRIGLDFAQIAWRTNEPAVCSLRVGQDTNSLILKAEEISFLPFHLIEAHELAPNTNYIFQIKCFDQAYNSSEFLGARFETLTPIDNTAPGNIGGFKAVYEKGSIKLSWKNPPDADLAGIRILRGDTFFFSDPWQAIPVYYDKQEYFIDKNISLDTKYYYSAFSYDYAGNYSSGATASVLTPKMTEAVGIPIIFSTSSVISPDISKANPDDVLVREKGQEAEILQRTDIKENVLYELVIPKDNIPAGTVQIIVGIRQDGEMSSFLLKKDEKGDFFGEIPRIYSAHGELAKFEVFFYNNQGNIVSFVEADTTVKTAEEEITAKPIVKTKEKTLSSVFLFFFPASLALLLIILIRFIREQKK